MWTVVKHWAELGLVLAVAKMFQNCASLADAYHVVSSADDVTRLGIVSATAIATGGFGGMLRALAIALRLPDVLPHLRTMFRGKENPAAGIKSKPAAATPAQRAPRARHRRHRPPSGRPARRPYAAPKPVEPEPQ